MHPSSLGASSIILATLIASCGGGAPPRPTVESQRNESSAEPAAAPTLSIEARQLVLDGVPIVTLVDGRVAAQEKGGGGEGLEISKLTAALQAAQAAQPGHLLRLVVDAETPYALLVECLVSAKQPGAEFTSFELELAGQERSPMIPLALSSSRAAASSSLGMVVGVSVTDLRVWSFSGSEGTITTPKLKVKPMTADAAQQVGAVLRDIAERTYGGGPRPADTNRIVLISQGAMPMRVVVPLLAAMRCPPGRARCEPAPDGEPYDVATMGLFPDVMFSSEY